MDVAFFYNILTLKIQKEDYRDYKTQKHDFVWFCFGTRDRTKSSVNTNTHNLPLISFLVPVLLIQIVL